MRDEDKTKKQLINELREFKQQDYELGAPESQRHQIEEKLRRSEERYRVLAENSMDGIYVVTPEGFEYVNPAFEKICGYKAKEVCNNEFNFIDLIHPEDRKLIAEREDARKKGKKLPSIYSFRVLTKDGKVKHVEVNTFRLPGEKTRILGMMRDITERKKAEEAIKESEEKFRSLAEQSPNMIFINKKGRVVYVNKKCEEIMGYKREEFYSPDFNFFTLIAPEFRKLVKTSFSSHMKGEEISPYEYALITKEGERIEAINATKLIHYGGESAILGVVTDITGRKRAEEELRESESKFRTIFQNVTDVITYVNKYGKILDVNRRVEELFGYKPDELIGKNFVKIGVLRPRDLPRIVKLFRDTIKSSKAMSIVELELKHKNGNKVFVEVGTRFIKKNGKVEGVLNIYRDITERKVAEEHFLRQNAISNAINKVFKKALICKNDREVAHTCLAVAEELTDSKFGFIGEVNQSGCFDTIALSNPGWDACTIPETKAVSMIKDMEIRGLWGKTIKEEKSFIVNDPSSHPESVGTPEGHPSIISFLGVPLKQGNRFPKTCQVVFFIINSPKSAC